jgi:hypothetical protein
VAAEALDDPARRYLVAAHHLAPVLGVHAGSQAGRTHEVAEEHGELATLGLGSLGRFGWFGCGLDGSHGCLGRGRPDPRKDLALAGRDLLNVH